MRNIQKVRSRNKNKKMRQTKPFRNSRTCSNDLFKNFTYLLYLLFEYFGSHQIDKVYNI